MPTKKYDFKKPMLDVDETVVLVNGKEVLLNDVLCVNIRNTSIKEDIVLKFFGWALDLKKTGVLSLDDDDKEKLKKYILSSDVLPTVSKGRLCEVLA